MTLTPAQDQTTLRPLGGAERLFHLWTREHPLHFSVAAEIDGAVTPEELRAALNAVQHRHPLLAAAVEDRSPDGPVFRRCGTAIPLAIAEAPATWEQIVSAELSQPFASREALQVRAVLCPGEHGCAIVLTFGHGVADGLSAMQVLSDVVAALNGRALEPRAVPAPLEELLGRAHVLPSGAQPPEPGEDGASADARLRAPMPVRPRWGSRPQVSSDAWSKELTQRLVERCRLERTTVHTALCAAATQAVVGTEGRDFVRVMSPISFRSVIDVEGDCGPYSTAVKTGFAAEQTRDLWSLARATGAVLDAARAPGVLATISAAIATMVPPGFDADAVQVLVSAGGGYELLVSNLGVVGVEASGPLRITALLGPAILNHLAGEQVVGVMTFEGVLRTTHVSHSPVPSLLHKIRSTLSEACLQPSTSLGDGRAAGPPAR